MNQIEEVCRTIEKTINQTVQNTLNSLEKDCEVISEAITDTLNNDRWLTKTLCAAGCGVLLLLSKSARLSGTVVKKKVPGNLILDCLGTYQPSENNVDPLHLQANRCWEPQGTL